MIVDVKQKIAFVHIPQNAGSNLKQSFLKYPQFKMYIPHVIPEDYKIPFKFSNFEPPVNKVDHLPAEWAPAGFTTIVLIKNPYHREVSQYNFLKNYFFFLEGARKFNDFTDFLKFKYTSDPDEVFYQNITSGYMRNKDQYYYTHKGKMNYFIFHEKLSEDWRRLQENYHLPNPWESTFNKNTHDDWRTYYKGGLHELVNNRDFEAFNYSLDIA